jgi:hypothetical protein
LVVNDLSWVESLLLQQVVEFEDSVIGELVQELRLYQEGLLVTLLHYLYV